MIISFCGKKSSGKTMLSEYHCNKYQYKLINFADSLKSIVCKTLNISLEELNNKKDLIHKNSININMNRLEKELNIDKNILSDLLIDKNFYTFREILQYIGTDIIRTHDEKWHIKKLEEYVKNHPFNNFCIGDVRFKNEKEFIENKLNGYCWYIKRNEALPDDVKILDTHISENDLNENDFGKTYLLINNKDKNYLFNEWNTKWKDTRDPLNRIKKIDPYKI